MKIIENKYSNNIFENIKHIDDKVMNIGLQESYKEYYNIVNGEILKK